jgi:hypothetical protein
MQIRVCASPPETGLRFRSTERSRDGVWRSTISQYAPDSRAVPKIPQTPPQKQGTRTLVGKTDSLHGNSAVSGPCTKRAHGVVLADEARDQKCGRGGEPTDENRLNAPPDWLNAGIVAFDRTEDK